MYPLIGFGVVLFLLTVRRPGTVAGVVLGAHGYFSSVGYLTGLPWSAVGIAATMLGMAYAGIDRYKQSGRQLNVYKPLMLPLVCLVSVFAIGVIQEQWRGIEDVGATGKAEGILEWVVSKIRRDDMNASWIIVTRWIPYLTVAVMGCALGGQAQLLNAFALAVVLQLVAIPHQVFEEFLKGIFVYHAPAGLEWIGINRAYLGYECCIAAMYFLVISKNEAKKCHRLINKTFLVLSFFIMLATWSKGPLFAGLLSVAIFLFFTKNNKYYDKTRYIGVVVITVKLGLVVGILLVWKLSESNPWLSGINTNLRFDQSSEIRWQLLSNAAYPPLENLGSWAWGRGFGWSRWQMSPDIASAVYVGSGTHVFAIDMFLDVGLVGLCLIAFGVLRLHFLGTSKSASKMVQSELTPLFIFIVFVAALVKLFLASDSYSEPILALYLGLLIERAMHLMQS